MSMSIINTYDLKYMYKINFYELNLSGCFDSNCVEMAYKGYLLIYKRY